MSISISNPGGGGGGGGLVADAINDGVTTVAPSQNAVFDALGLLVPKSLVDAKGDLLAGTADNTVARLAVGSNGQVLTADSAETAGVKWATPSGGGSGDVVGPSSSTDGRAAEFDGTTGKLLKVAPLTGDGGRPKLDSDGTWADILIPSTIARDSEVAAAVLPKLSMPFLPTGEWSHCTPGATAVGNTPVSGGLIGWVLVYIPWSFDRLGLATTTGVASSTMRLGLYNIGTNGLPGTSILLPSGTLSVATSASTAEYTVSSGPLGWVAAVFQSASSGTPQVRTSSLGLAAQTYPFLQPRSNGTSNGLQFASRADAALPSDLTGFTWTSLTTGNWNMHQFRKA